MVEYSPPDLSRFWSRVDKTSSPHGCWLYKGAPSQRYPLIHMGGRVDGVHRISYRIHHGEIPPRMHVCHDCMGHGAPQDNKRCVNPAHLFIDTPEGHAQDRLRKGQVPRGALNGHRTHPESTVRGDAHYARKMPELVLRGESHGMSALNDAAVREIRRLYRPRVMSYGKLAKRFGVTRQLIYFVVHRKIWAHVPD